MNSDWRTERDSSYPRDPLFGNMDVEARECPHQSSHTYLMWVLCGTLPLMSASSSAGQPGVSGVPFTDARALERGSLRQIARFGEWIFVGLVIVAIESLFSPSAPSIFQIYCSGPGAPVPPWCASAYGQVDAAGAYAAGMVATGAVFQLLATFSAIRAFNTISKVDLSFRNFAKLSMIAFAGVLVIAVEMLSAAFRIPGISEIASPGASFMTTLIIGLVPASVGYVGIIYGIINLGDRYEVGDLGTAAGALLGAIIVGSVAPPLGPLVGIYGIYKLVAGTRKAMP